MKTRITTAKALLVMAVTLSSSFALADGTVPPPPHGLQGNSNYVLASSNCTPIKSLTVTIHVTQSLVSNSNVWGFQLLAYSFSSDPSKKEPITVWQQYMAGPQNGNTTPVMVPSIELFAAHGSEIGPTGPKLTTPEMLTLVRGNGYPAGYNIVITLATNQDQADAVNFASFGFRDGNGKQLGYWDTSGTQLAKFSAPIAAVMLTTQGTLLSGAGTITYASPTPMFVTTLASLNPSQTTPPSGRYAVPCTETTVTTAERGNGVFGKMPQGNNTIFTQCFASPSTGQTGGNAGSLYLDACVPAR